MFKFKTSQVIFIARWVEPVDLGSKPKLFEKEEIIQKSFISANFANRPSISWKSLGTSKTLKNSDTKEENKVFTKFCS